MIPPSTFWLVAESPAQSESRSAFNSSCALRSNSSSSFCAFWATPVPFQCRLRHFLFILHFELLVLYGLSRFLLFSILRYCLPPAHCLSHSCNSKSFHRGPRVLQLNRVMRCPRCTRPRPRRMYVDRIALYKARGPLPYPMGPWLTPRFTCHISHKGRDMTGY